MHYSIEMFFDAPTHDRLDSILKGKLNLNLSSIGIFVGKSNAVFLQPVVTRELLDFHRVLHNLFQNDNHVGWEYYLPGTWVPHCALDISTDADVILSSTDFITRHFTPFWGYIDKLCLYECSRPKKKKLATFLLENMPATS